MTVRFCKMHGLGNDFVVIDERVEPVALTPAQVRRIADRRRGVGFDQLLIIEPTTTHGADVFMRILNPDGGEAKACGNGTRCVADLVMREMGRDDIVIDTVAGTIGCRRNPDDSITCDMGQARTEWRDIPLAKEVDTAHLPLSIGEVGNPVAVGMGNPHVVFFVDDAESVDLTRLGPVVESHSLFPDRTNVEFAQIVGPDTVRMRVWERGAGVTQACGSGACATAVAAHRRGLTGRLVRVQLDGGDLMIEWLSDGRVTMTGPSAAVFTGVFDPAFLAEE
jgi:diaminopimelate epimerase